MLLIREAYIWGLIFGGGLYLGFYGMSSPLSSINLIRKSVLCFRLMSLDSTCLITLSTSLFLISKNICLTFSSIEGPILIEQPFYLLSSSHMVPFLLSILCTILECYRIDDFKDKDECSKLLFLKFLYILNQLI